ncbi:MAG: FixH family protein [Micropepsaceae bacterium]
MKSIHAIGRAALIVFSGLLTLAILSACGKPESPYVFVAVQSEIPMNGEAIVDVRLVHQPSGKPVESAVIFETRFDMDPESMGGMAAPVTAQGSPAPGVYRFMVAPTMAGRWALKLSAKVQGETETVTGSVVVTVR